MERVFKSKIYIVYVERVFISKIYIVYVERVFISKIYIVYIMERVFISGSDSVFSCFLNWY